MALRKAHGTAAKGGSVLVVETRPADEQAHGIARSMPVDTREGRDQHGRFLPGTAGAQAHARAGGVAKAGWSRLAHSIGLGIVAADPSWAPYQRAATSLAEQHIKELRRNVGGGRVPANVRSMVQRAAMQDAASTWHADVAASLVATDPKIASAMFVTASRLADAAKASWLTVHELARVQAREPSAPEDLDAVLPPKRTE